ncbi:adenosylhomocysteinase like 2b isoform X2 [Tachysurus ichikawai]
MSVQVVAAKMAEVELKDVPKKESLVVSPVNPKTDEKGSLNNEANVSVTCPLSDPVVRGDPSPVSPNPVKMPQASAMKRPDPQQNGGEAFVNSDGTVAEAPRMKKVTIADLFLYVETYPAVPK